MLLEACIDSVASALAAQTGGADRIELCADLAEGGTTPTVGTIALCRERVRIPIYVMIRPRGGDFLYSSDEVAVMRRDIAQARAHGADGVVLGLLRRDGTVDVPRTRLLVDAARPLDVTFHRAIDVARDAEAALDALIGLGVDRVLTSGQASTALRGAATIARLVERAHGRIAILAGGGVDEKNLKAIVRRSGVKEVHVRGTRAFKSAMRYRPSTVRFREGRGADYIEEVTDAARIRRMVKLLQSA